MLTYTLEYIFVYNETIHDIGARSEKEEQEKDIYFLNILNFKHLLYYMLYNKTEKCRRV